MKLLLLALLTFQQAAPRPDSVVVEPRSVVLAVDATQPFTARAYADGRVLEDTAARWFSPDEEVLVIDNEGVATAVWPGEIRLAATVAGVPGYATVIVEPRRPASVVARLPVEAVLLGTSVPLDVTVRASKGEVLREVSIDYKSDDRKIASVDDEGRIVGHALGTTTLTVSAGEAMTTVAVQVAPNPAVSYQVAQNRITVRTGDVVRFRVQARTDNDEAVTGLRPAWVLGHHGAQIDTEGTDGVFVAEEPGTYTITALIGPEITRTVRVEVAPRTYQTQLEKVGRGPTANHRSGDMWVFEGIDGRDYVYVGTFYYDWMKVWDVTDPENPVLTDSLQLDARRINDVKIHPNNRLGIVTREGASNRRNGIVLLDLSTPAHPTILSEYTETVTGGVHNVWILGEEDLVYAVHNGTRDLHILDISDPANTKEVGRWSLGKERRSLHDVIVQDGYAYLSYWDDGVIVLDAGAGTHGGTPTQPTFVSQLKYPVGNTHVAWRHGRYLYVGDEIYPPDWDPNNPAPIEASGYIHVLDMTDIENPVEVARYEVPEAGAHNVWVDDDKLYIGYYQGGLRVVDVSGELRGDLYRQGREMAALKTTDHDTIVPNWPMTWGAQLFKGRIYSSDMNSGLWITRLVEQALVP